MLAQIMQIGKSVPQNEQTSPDSSAALSRSDQALIAALRDNARRSVTELAHLTGLSRTTVRTRLDQLVRSGRIRRFTIETDVDVEGEVRAITMIALQGQMSHQVIRALARIPGVTTIWSTNGAWDLVVDIRTGSLVAFDTVLREIRGVAGVVNSESSLLLAHAADMGRRQP